MKRVAAAGRTAVALIVLIAACSSPEPRPPPVIAPPAVEPPPPAAAPPVPEQPAPATVAPAASLQALMRKSRPAIPTRPLNVKAQCQFRDPTGYRGSLKLKVSGAEVREFEAAVTIPNRGVCRFALKDFVQAERLPNVRLAAAGGSCSVRMWEQGARTTVAFSECAAMCSGDAVDYLWPIFVETKRGRCS